MCTYSIVIPHCHGRRLCKLLRIHFGYRAIIIRRQRRKSRLLRWHASRIEVRHVTTSQDTTDVHCTGCARAKLSTQGQIITTNSKMSVYWNCNISTSYMHLYPRHWNPTIMLSLQLIHTAQCVYACVRVCMCPLPVTEMQLWGRCYNNCHSLKSAC